MYLLQDLIDFFHFEIDDIVHDTLRQFNMFTEKFEIEISIRSKRIYNIRVEIDRQQTAAIIRAERYFATRIGGNGTESQIGITIGYRLPYNRIPKQNSGFGRLPRIVYDFFPNGLSIDLFRYHRAITVYRILLSIRTSIDSCLHKIVGHFHRDICSGNFSFGHFGIDKRLRIGVFYRDTEHQCPASSILGNLTGGIGIAFHKRHQTGRCQRRIFYRRPFGSDMGQIVPDPSPAFHKLHLLFVDFHHATIRVGISFHTYHKAVR